MEPLVEVLEALPYVPGVELPVVPLGLVLLDDVERDPEVPVIASVRI
jgi:hypothetical protein